MKKKLYAANEASEARTAARVPNRTAQNRTAVRKIIDRLGSSRTADSASATATAAATETSATASSGPSPLRLRSGFRRGHNDGCASSPGTILISISRSEER